LGAKSRGGCGGSEEYEEEERRIELSPHSLSDTTPPWLGTEEKVGDEEKVGACSLGIWK
jgi:hypothetical protein